MTDQPSSTGEPYLRVEDVAERLGLPLSVLMGRVAAGDIPSRREEDAEGVHYWLRLGDLGIGAWDDRGGEGDEDTRHVGDAIQSAFNPGEPARLADDAPWSLDGGLPSQWPGMEHPLAGTEPEAPTTPAPAASPTPQRRDGAAQGADEVATPAAHDVPETPEWLRVPLEQAGPGTAADAATPAETAAEQVALPVDVVELELPPAPSRLPVPRAAPHLDVLEATSPRGDLATMSLDARELVAGLLDRWERTLEQRIYTEQRQRFESELTARQNAVKQLQMELHSARAEHAAAQAEKDRMLAEKERELADREREVAEAKQAAAEAQARRRRWFRRTDD